jgi:hypothetical protein
MLALMAEGLTSWLRPISLVVGLLRFGIGVADIVDEQKDRTSRPPTGKEYRMSRILPAELDGVEGVMVEPKWDNVEDGTASPPASDSGTDGAASSDEEVGLDESAAYCHYD